MIISASIKRKGHRLAILMGMLMLGLTSLQAQNDAPTKGIVTDLRGNPIAGVEIALKGGDAKVMTANDGTFDFTFKKGDVVTFTHPDYLFKEEKIGKIRSLKVNETYSVHLIERFVSTDKDIVGPYGEHTPASNYLGSQSTVYTKDLDKYLSPNIMTALQGRMAGFNISQYRGFALRNTTSNSEAAIAAWIPSGFGINSYGDNSQFSYSSRGMGPVVIVDGIERELFSLDPEAMESVPLQRDALSSMFLGMQSSRGALIITTKNPTSGNLHLSLTGKLGVNHAVNRLHPLSADKYAYLLNEALQNDGKSALYGYDDYMAFQNGTNPYLYPNVNWIDELMRKNSISQSYNLNVSGGGRVAQFFVSLGYLNEQGPFRTSNEHNYNTNLNLNRYMLSSKVHINITDDFEATLTALGRITEGNQPGGTGSGYSDLLRNIYTTPNNAYPVYNPDGTWGGNRSFTNNLRSQTVNSGYISDNQRDIQATLKLRYDFGKLVKGLSAHMLGSVATLTRTAITRTKQAPVYAYSLDDLGEPMYTLYGSSVPQTNNFTSVASYNMLYGQMSVNYDRPFGLHTLHAALTGDTRHEIDDYDLPMIPSNVMEKISYDYAKRYFAQVAVTESYYNRYAPGNRWGTFCAFGLGWDIAQEAFMEQATWVDRLKLRAVWGKTGNGIGNSGYYTYRQTFSDPYGYYTQGTTQGQGNLFAQENELANPYRTWEKAHKLNIGLDAAFLRNRLSFAIDYYNDKYYDLLQNRGKSIELLGTAYPTENIGKTRQTGVELQLTWQDHIRDFNYYLSANWSLAKSKLLYMDEQRVEYDWLRLTGRPVGVTYGLQANGFLTTADIASGYPVITGYEVQPGDVKYVDQNGDNVIDEFDRVVIGGDKPLRYFGVDLGFEWKGLEFSMLWQGAYKRDLYVDDQTLVQGFLGVGSTYGQAYENILGRWTPETASTATYPRLSAGGNSYNMGAGMGSSLWMHSGNYLRLKNISLAYNLPELLCKNYLGGVRVKLFVNAQNLLTFSATDLVDPEVTFTSSPLQRCIITGINLKF